MNLFFSRRQHISDNVCYVIDGGFLLHKVVWRKGEIFSAICQFYVKCLFRHFGRKAVIVFDGYTSDIMNKNTESAERLRRAEKLTSPDILFESFVTATVSQDKFLLNERNNSRLIEMLKMKFLSSGLRVKQHDEDADVLIVHTALEISKEYEFVIIVRGDTDLLVRNYRQRRKYIFHEAWQRKVKNTIVLSRSLKNSNHVKHILVYHATTGCDTTSAIFN